MAIAKSQIVEDSRQADGRRAIRERHTEDNGRTHDIDYIGERNRASKQ